MAVVGHPHDAQGFAGRTIRACEPATRIFHPNGLVRRLAIGMETVFDFIADPISGVALAGAQHRVVAAEKIFTVHQSGKGAP